MRRNEQKRKVFFFTMSQEEIQTLTSKSVDPHKISTSCFQYSIEILKPISLPDCTDSFTLLMAQVGSTFTTMGGSRFSVPGRATQVCQDYEGIV